MNAYLSVYIYIGTGSNNSLHLYGPSGIVQDSNSKEFYIADTYNYRIVTYPSGNVVAGDNGPGYTYNKLHTPISLFYDSLSKSYLIANSGGIQFFLQGQSEGKTIAGVNGITGTDPIHLINP